MATDLKLRHRLMRRRKTVKAMVRRGLLLLFNPDLQPQQTSLVLAIIVVTLMMCWYFLIVLN